MRVQLVHADGNVKSRPALLLQKAPPYNDWIVCVISTRVRNMHSETDLHLDGNHPDFSNSGLIAPSIIRLTQIFTISTEMIEGSIGALSKDTYGLCIDRLTAYLKKGLAGEESNQDSN